MSLQRLREVWVLFDYYSGVQVLVYPNLPNQHYHHFFEFLDVSRLPVSSFAVALNENSCIYRSTALEFVPQLLLEISLDIFVLQLQSLEKMQDLT